MSKISTYEVVPVPKLADKLIGTSVGGEIEDITYNFTLAELLNLFIPNIPSSTLQGVLDNGNSATQDIILDGTVYTTNLEVTDTATILNSYLNGDTHILGALYDVNNLKGIAGDVLSSTGTGVEWITLPPIFTPNLQQVLEVGNTADIDIILDANIEALDINVDTATINNNITIDGTITDGDSSVGTLNQVLSSTGTKVKWVNLPSYSATSPLFLDSITGVFSIQQSDNTHNGYLSYIDWITFNGKQPAGNYITALTGEATATGPGSVTISLSNPAVIGKVLSGLSVTGGSISATDSILTAFGKVQGQLNALVGGVMFKGVWNASTNNPTLTSSVGTQGWYYIVNVAGNTDLNGITDWQVGDWAIFNGSTWNKIDNTDLVTSVNGQTGAVSLTTDNISEGITNLYYTDTRARNSVSATTPLAYNNISGVFSIQSANSSQNGYLSSTDWSTFNSKQDALSGTGLVKSTTGVISYITDNSSNWDIAYDNSIISAAVTGTSVKTLTLNQQDGGTITATWSDANTGLTSVGLSMPSAFSVSNSPLVSNGTIGVTGAGTASQYIRGDGQLATFPASGGGGSSVSYYLNGGTSQGTIAGDPYEEMSKTAVVGTNTDFNISTDGYVASFLTDAGDPALLQIPGGNWNFELFFSASSSGGTPSYYVELYKYDGVVLTLIADNSASPEGITGGTSIDLYVTALAVPQTSLTITDRLAIRVYVAHSGRTITLHTQGTHLCQVITTFSTGISALNGLTAQVQYFATGTAGTDFAINSATATHTFNLPTASATNRGALSTADWTTFNNKADAFIGTTDTVSKFTSSTTIGNSNIKDNGNVVTINTSAGGFGALQVGNYNGSILMNTSNTNGGLIFQNTSSSNKLWDFSSYNNDIHFNESNIGYPVMTLKSGGNVGIKQINPSYQLDVDGTFRNTGVVTLGNLAGSGNRMVIADSSGVLSTQVITTGTVTAVTASSPLASSGGNTPNITIQQSSGSQNGYLSSTDWTTFNNKQASGNYITSLTGEATGTGPGATTVTLNNAAVTGKVLTGINITGGTVVDTDSILTGFGKLQNQINGLIGGSIYQGTWNANTNTPTLTSGVGVKGYYYIVSVAGTTNLDGITDWFVGDWAIFDGTAWQQVDNTDAVVSVNGQTGAVSLTTDNIPEGATNLYFLDSRARAALSFTAGSGAYNSTTGVITIPTNTSQLTNGANFITLASLSATSPIGYNSSTGAISITQSGTSSNGYLSSTDWNTFNGKQSTITLTTTGTSGVATFSSNTLNIPNYGSALTGYVPYTGATSAVNLGSYGITAASGVINGNLKIEGDGTANTALMLKNNLGSSYFQNSAGYTAIYASSTTALSFINNIGSANYKSFILESSGLTSNTTRTYTLPDATGTLALTSNLSSYLPLTGGTLTGALGGTTATFSGNLTLNGYGNQLKIGSNGGTDGFIGIGSGQSSMFIGDYAIGTKGLTLNLSTGAATFSSSVTATTLNINGGTTASFVLGVDVNSTFAFGSTNGKRVAIIRDSTAADNGLQFGYDTTDKTGIIAGSATSAGCGIDFYTYNGSSWGNRMRVTKDGNVGIGTSSPTSIGTGYTTLHILGTSGGGMAFGNGTATSYVYTDSALNIQSGNFPIAFLPNGTEAMRITSGGLVGIGTTNPNIYGNGFNNQFTVSTTSGYANISVAGSSGNGGGIDFGNQTVRQAGVYGLDGSNLGFYTNGSNSGNGLSERMRITSGGNVLIGTTTDAGYKLDVNGTGRFSSLVAEASVAEIRLKGGNYGGSYNTSLRSIAGAIGVLQFGNNGENYVLIGNTATSSNTFLSFRVNATTESITSGTEAFRISSTGAGNSSTSFAGAATFSSSVTAGGDFIFNAASRSIVFNSTNTLLWENSGSLNLRTGGVDRLTIASTGASTFLSSITDRTKGVTIQNIDGYYGRLQFSSNANYYIGGGDYGAELRISSGNSPIQFYTNGSEKLSISPTGAATFSSLGTGTVTASSGTLSTVSDSSYKIADGFIEDALPSVMNLKPRYFYWKDKSGLDTTIRQLGFYAQEVNSAIGEEAANTPKKDSPWGINDRSVIAMLTKAIQEQMEIINELKEKIITLESK